MDDLLGEHYIILDDDEGGILIMVILGLGIIVEPK